MVDVRKVITGEQGSTIDLNGKVVIPACWLAVQTRLSNIVLTTEFSNIIDSEKYSWRILGEMLLELQEPGIPDWARMPYLLIDLKEHLICNLRVVQPTFLVNGFQSQMGRYPYGWSGNGNPGSYDWVTPPLERLFNQEMMAVSGKKFPIKLPSLTPTQGAVTVDIPVEKIVKREKREESAVDQLFRELKIQGS